MRELLANDWLVWGLVLLIGLPSMVVFLGELAESLKRRGAERYRKPLDLFRNSCLFLLFGTILLQMVVGLPSNHLAVKVSVTLFFISVLNAALALSNAIMFEGAADAWQSKAPKLLIDLGRFFVVAVGAALIVSYVWEVDLTGLLAALGVGSLVIGLALQDTLSNVFSGVTMLSSSQFKIGSWIKVGDIEGRVRSVSWRSVSVATGSGDIIDIPNSVMSKDKLRVYGAENSRSQVLADVKIGYRYAPERVKEMLLEALRAVPTVLPEPKPAVSLVELQETTIHYRVAYYVADFRQAGSSRSELYSNLWYVASRAGIPLDMVAASSVAEQLEMMTRPDAVMTGAASATSARQLAQRLLNLGTFQRPLEALEALTADATVERYRKGEALITPGRRGMAAHVVLSGMADAVGPAAEGEPVICTFCAGDLVVFKAFFRGGDAPLTVRATTDLEVIRLPMPTVVNALSRDAHLAQQVEHLMSMREGDDGRGGTAKPIETAMGQSTDADRADILKKLFAD